MSEVLLSVIIPVYNEEDFVATMLDRILAAPLPQTGHSYSRELIVVDDASRDQSARVIQEYINEHPEAPIRLLQHPVNRGKGAAIRTALEHATGEYTIIQDADLEYDPKEISNLFQPLLEGSADVVYGSRFASAGTRRVFYYWHSVANKFLTTFCNIASDLNLTDMETCYKLFRTALLKSIPIRSNRFGFEPEITIKIAKRQARVYEVPITYRGRTYEEGKKIGLGDAFTALFVILRYAFTNDLYTDEGHDILDSLARTDRFNKWMADTVSPYLGSNVLELGAGMGNLTRQLCPRRRSYVASDIDGEHLARLAARMQHRPNVNTAVVDLTDSATFRQLQQTFDSVVCLNVLEHVEDDLGALRNIHAALRPNGRAIILVPQGASAYGTLDTALGHFRRYSISELESKMKAAGFELEEMLQFNRVTYPGWYLNGRILKRRTFSRLQVGIFERLVPVTRRLDRFLPWPPTSIIAVGARQE